MPRLFYNSKTREKHVGFFPDELKKQLEDAENALKDAVSKCKTYWDADVAIAEICSACQLYVSGLYDLGFDIVGQQIAKKQEELKRVLTQNYSGNGIRLIVDNAIPCISGGNTVRISVVFETIEEDEYIYINTYTFVFETWLDKKKMKEEAEKFKTANLGLNLSRLMIGNRPVHPRNLCI